MAATMTDRSKVDAIVLRISRTPGVLSRASRSNWRELSGVTRLPGSISVGESRAVRHGRRDRSWLVLRFLSWSVDRFLPVLLGDPIGRVFSPPSRDGKRSMRLGQRSSASPEPREVWVKATADVVFDWPASGGVVPVIQLPPRTS